MCLLSVCFEKVVSPETQGRKETLSSALQRQQPEHDHRQQREGDKRNLSMTDGVKRAIKIASAMGESMEK